MRKIIISFDEDAMTYDVEFGGNIGYACSQAMLITALTRVFKNGTGCSQAKRLRLAQALRETIQQFGKEESEMSDPIKVNGDNKLGEQKSIKRIIIDMDEADGNGDVHFEGRVDYNSSVCALLNTLIALITETAKCDEDETMELVNTLADIILKFEAKHDIDKSVLRIIE